MCIDQLEDQETLRHCTLPPGSTLSPQERIDRAHLARTDSSVTKTTIERVDRAVARYGYHVEKSLGRVKGHPIFKVVPSTERMIAGEFPDNNPFPKIVTAQDLANSKNPQETLNAWFGQYLRILYAVRQGLLTTLYRAVYDENTRLLLLFSEFVDNPRFGSDLAKLHLTWMEALGLGYLVSNQVAQLHAKGLAHNNICNAALLLKADPASLGIRPAMVGLVAPSLRPEALQSDIRRLAQMILGWAHPKRVHPLEPHLQTEMKATRGVTLLSFWC